VLSGPQRRSLLLGIGRWEASTAVGSGSSAGRGQRKRRRRKGSTCVHLEKGAAAVGRRRRTAGDGGRSA
jgi:hypothetical protein